MGEKEPSIIHLCIHKKLKEKFKGRPLTVKSFYYLLGITYHLEKSYWPPILKEMEQMNLVKKQGRHVEVLDIELDVNDTSWVYQKVGLF